MSIYRVFPLPEVEDLQISQALCDVSSFPGCESFAIVGENSLLKSSLLLQAGLSYVSNGDQVIFIRPSQFKTVPFPVEGMLTRTTALLDCIKMVSMLKKYPHFGSILESNGVKDGGPLAKKISKLSHLFRLYISEPLGLIRYLCEIHMTGILPSAIIVEDFFYYVTHHQEHNKDYAVFKLFALLEDTTAYISKMRKAPCHRLISMHKPPCAKSSMKKYFKEIWQLSLSDNGSEILLTDDHIPAFRITFHLENDDNGDKIVLDKLFRLSAVDNS